MKYLKNIRPLQQGDVILKAVELEDGDLGEKEPNLILAHGESGHTHVVFEGLAQIFLLNGTSEGKRVLEVLSDYAFLKHEEHKGFKVPKGTWEIGRVMEYDHFKEEAREVMD